MFFSAQSFLCFGVIRFVRDLWNLLSVYYPVILIEHGDGACQNPLQRAFSYLHVEHLFLPFGIGELHVRETCFREPEIRSSAAFFREIADRTRRKRICCLKNYPRFGWIFLKMS